jgi:hypothetical protein
MTRLKQPSIVSQKLRDSAKGKDCTLRLEGICNFDPATTVLCHVPCNMRGTSLKGPDVVACFGCSACHAVLDREPWKVDAWDVVRAVAETWMYWLREGLIKVAGVKA